MKATKKRILRYDRSFIAHTDILGFGALIKTVSPGEISKILRVFKEAHRGWKFDEALPKGERRSRRFVNFSDLCIITNRLTHPSARPDFIVFFELFSLARAQEVLLRVHKVILRGGVTIGMSRTSRGLVYGPGIIEAYKLESETAKYPRIVVSQTVVDEMDRFMKGVHRPVSVKPLLTKDTDGVLFLDYLGLVKQLHPTDMARVLAVHRRFAEKGLQTLPEHREKYDWLMRQQVRVENMKPGLG